MKIKVKTNTGFIELETDKPFLEKSRCRGCGKEIYWGKTKNGKAMPVSVLGNGDMVSHFYDCPKQGNFRKKGDKKQIENNEEMSMRTEKILCDRCKREFTAFIGNWAEEEYLRNKHKEFICPICKEDSDLDNF